MEFGFLIDGKEFDFDDFSIKIKENHFDVIERFYTGIPVSEGWIYGPLRTLRQSPDELRKFKAGAPVVSCGAFSLECTHLIESSCKDDEHLKFLILGYGFLQGMLLLPEGHQYLMRTAYRPGQLTGLLLCGNDYEKGMGKINRFFIDSSKEEQKLMFSIIHWFLMGQSYEHQWEVFDAQYRVMDALFKLLELKNGNAVLDKKCKQHIPHSKRIEELSHRYEVLLPEWAKLDEHNKVSDLSDLRNNFSHEATYANEAISYSVSHHNYSLEFIAFNVKIIAASLGIRFPYLKARHEDPNRWAWDIE